MNLAGLLSNWFPADFGEFLKLVLESTACMGTALICGIVVGHQRQRKKKPAGIRTHTLVCLGSAAFVHLGVITYKLSGVGGVDGVAGLGTIADFNRLIQSVATGIGFLGAGVIMRSDTRLRGVTTAASVWVTGAIGAAAGGGAIVFALILTVMTFLVLRWSGEVRSLDELEETLDGAHGDTEK